MKHKFLLTFYWIFDLCLSLAPIVLFYCFRHSVNLYVILINYIFASSIYLAINSLVGMICDKKHKNQLEELPISKNWLLPMYLENIFLFFALIVTIGFTVDSFVRFSNDIISCLLFLLSSIIILILVFGQLAWERTVIRSPVIKLIKYYACLANPLRIAFFELLFISSIAP
ncbi:hypothetical protein [Treponema sp. C6A8]|uniref:hypothetical protein n=1 Tax=Treponema sp. C6A8 TaxID=1410609 RepID=UPI00047F8988|nr:hypothetical protein [Treponema sp. C6A8]